MRSCPRQDHNRWVWDDEHVSCFPSPTVHSSNPRVSRSTTHILSPIFRFPTQRPRSDCPYGHFTCSQVVVQRVPQRGLPGRGYDPFQGYRGPHIPGCQPRAIRRLVRAVIARRILPISDRRRWASLSTQNPNLLSPQPNPPSLTTAHLYPAYP